MKNIIVLPNFDRPEFLHVCLELIQKADKSEEMMYLFCFDHDYDRELMKVYESFPYKKHLIKMNKHNYNKLTKQSRNVLNGLIAAAALTGEGGHVFLIEDDIFVGTDFLTFHLDLHNMEKTIFCSILSANNNSKFNCNNNEDAYYLSDKADYQSLGVCFKSANIIEYVEPHNNEWYYKDPFDYCKKNFPHSSIGHEFAEQDGLIRRIKEQSRTLTAFAHVPRCYHAGFYGKNRGKYKRGNLTEKIKRVKAVCFNDKEMRKAAQHEQYYNDSKPVNLDTTHSKLKLQLCQHKPR